MTLFFLQVFTIKGLRHSFIKWQLREPGFHSLCSTAPSQHQFGNMQMFSSLETFSHGMRDVTAACFSARWGTRRRRLVFSTSTNSVSHMQNYYLKKRKKMYLKDSHAHRDTTRTQVNVTSVSCPKQTDKKINRSVRIQLSGSHRYMTSQKCGIGFVRWGFIFCFSF